MQTIQQDVHREKLDAAVCMTGVMRQKCTLTGYYSFHLMLTLMLGTAILDFWSQGWWGSSHFQSQISDWGVGWAFQLMFPTGNLEVPTLQCQRNGPDFDSNPCLNLCFCVICVKLLFYTLCMNVWNVGLSHALSWMMNGRLCCVFFGGFFQQVWQSVSVWFHVQFDCSETVSSLIHPKYKKWPKHVLWAQSCGVMPKHKNGINVCIICHNLLISWTLV